MRSVRAIVLSILLAGPGAAQSQAPARAAPMPDEAPAQPLPLRVRPSGTDALSEEARERQERLDARMRRNELLFRSICRHCSRAVDPLQGKPFEPLQALRPGAIGSGGRPAPAEPTEPDAAPQGE